MGNTNSSTGTAHKTLTREGAYLCGMTGGNGGTYEQLLTRSTLKQITAQMGYNSITALRLKFWDGTEKTYGRMGSCLDNKQETFDIGKDEYITEYSAWGNGIGERLGALHLKTNLNRCWDPVMTEWGKRTEFKYNCGSGMIVGCDVRHCWEIDAFGFIFLDTIIGIEINGKVDEKSPICQTKQHLAYFTNSTPNTEKYEKTMTRTTGLSRTFELSEQNIMSHTQSHSLNIGISGGKSAGIGGGKEISGTVGYSYTNSKTEQNIKTSVNTSNVTNTTSNQETFCREIPPYSKLCIEVTENEYSVLYALDATVVFKTEEGQHTILAKNSKYSVTRSETNYKTFIEDLKED